MSKPGPIGWSPTFPNNPPKDIDSRGDDSAKFKLSTIVEEQAKPFSGRPRLGTRAVSAENTYPDNLHRPKVPVTSIDIELSANTLIDDLNTISKCLDANTDTSETVAVESGTVGSYSETQFPMTQGTFEQHQQQLTFAQLMVYWTALDPAAAKEIDQTTEQPSGIIETRVEKNELQYQQSVSNIAAKISPSSPDEVLEVMHRALKAPYSDAEIPTVRVLNILFCAAGGWNSLPVQLHPETDACATFLSRLTQDKRLDYLEKLYKAFELHLTPKQRTAIQTGLEGIKFAMKAARDAVGYAIGAIRADLANHLRESPSLLAAEVRKLIDNDKATENPTTRVLLVLLCAAGGEIAAQLARPEIGVCSNRLANLSDNDRFEYLKHLYISLQPALTPIQNSPIVGFFSPIQNSSGKSNKPDFDKLRLDLKALLSQLNIVVT